MHTAQQARPGFPITIAEIVTGKREIACRLRWEHKDTGEQKYGIWWSLVSEEKTKEMIQDLNEQYEGIDHHWIEYGYV